MRPVRTPRKTEWNGLDDGPTKPHSKQSQEGLHSVRTPEPQAVSAVPIIAWEPRVTSLVPVPVLTRMLTQTQSYSIRF